VNLTADTLEWFPREHNQFVPTAEGLYRFWRPTLSHFPSIDNYYDFWRLLLFFTRRVIFLTVLNGCHLTN